MQTTMTELRNWKLDHKKDDIRGWSLRDVDGQLLGTVDELVVDTDSKHVTQVVLDDGKRFSARDVLIGENDLRLVGVGKKLAAERETRAAERETRAAERERLAESQRLTAKPKAATPAPAPANVAAKEELRTAELRTNELRTDELRTDELRTNERDLVVPIIEEEIRIGKREVDAGGMHVRSKIVTEPFDEDLRLREEHVTVERRAVDQPLTLADAETRLREGVVELRATSEQAVVDKRARVVEEVLLKKDSAEHVEHIRDSIRHTEVEVTEIKGNGVPKARKGV